MAGLKPSDFPALTISLEQADTPHRICTAYADRWYGTLMAPDPKRKGWGKNTVGVSILSLPETYSEWWEKVAYVRRKVRRAERAGYTFARIDRNVFLDDIYEINTSSPDRQGKPMTDEYLKRPQPATPLPSFPCARHQQHHYGIVRDGRLYAYSWVYQVGEACMFSTILGHSDHLEEGIMYSLVAGALGDLIEVGKPSYAMYTMHFAGTDGLRYFKEKLGFAASTVTWLRTAEMPARRGFLDRLRARTAL